MLFVLNKVDLRCGPRTTVSQALVMLREQGFVQPEIYPVSAEAARLFSLEEGELTPADQSALRDFYTRFAPGDNSLSAYARTGENTRRFEGWEVGPERLRLALQNTGLPLLTARLRALAQDRASQMEPDPAASVQGRRAPEENAPAESVPGEQPPAETTAARQALAEATPADLASDGLEPPEDPADLEDLNALLGADPSETDPSADPSETNSSADPAETDLSAAPSAANRPAEANSNPAADPSAAAPSEEADPNPNAPSEEDDELDFSDIAAIFGEVLPEEFAPGPGAKPDRQGDSDPETTLDGSRGNPDAESAPEEAPAQNPAQTPAASRFGELLALGAQADCAGLLDLARQVQNSDATQEEKEGALEALHAAYKAREVEELQNLTRDLDSLDLTALQNLVDRINGGAYTVQVRTPYLEQVAQRMDQIHVQQLETLCAKVEEADSRTLARIRTEVERRDCAEVLKTECYRRIEQRQDALDLEDLERITRGAETMSEKELRALAVTLEANNWSPKYVTAYRHRISLLREVALVRELQNQMEELNLMERREVLTVLERAQGLNLPARLLAGPLAQARERLFRLDMLRLLALNNDFDLLNFEDIDNLRAQVARTDVCEAARRTYLGRLLERENNLILENTSARADLTRQLMGQHKMRQGDFALSTSTPDFQDQVARLWGGTGLEQPRDLPVFIFYNASTYAFSGQRFWYKTGRDLAFLPLAEIDHFQVMKQRLTLNLQIVRKDNTYLLTEARISRGGAQRTLDFLNDCVRRWEEAGLAETYPVTPIRTRRFEASDYAAPVEPVIPTPEMALELFKTQYAEAKLREGNLIREGEESWENRTRRLRQNFGLSERTPLIWYESASILGTVKEGLALGPGGLYQKEGKQPTLAIPLEEIYAVKAAGSKRATVFNLQNQSWTLPISDSMVPLIGDYVRTIQLGDLLRQLREEPQE